jgi:hypothetical protein
LKEIQRIVVAAQQEYGSTPFEMRLEFEEQSSQDGRWMPALNSVVQYIASNEQKVDVLFLTERQDLVKHAILISAAGLTVPSAPEVQVSRVHNPHRVPPVRPVDLFVGQVHLESVGRSPC